MHSLPSLYLCLGLLWPTCRTLHLAVLNFMKFAQAQIPSLSQSLCIESLPYSPLTVAHVVRKLAESALISSVMWEEECHEGESKSWEWCRDMSWVSDSLKKCSNTGLLGILMRDFLNSSCKTVLLIKYIMTLPY